MTHYFASGRLKAGDAAIITGSGSFCVSADNHTDGTNNCPTDLVLGALCS